MKTVIYGQLTKKQLGTIKPLWEELNEIHFDDSVYFKDHFLAMSFETRAARWQGLPEEDVHLLVVYDEKNVAVGYCVSTVKGDRSGEVDSLFLRPAFRGSGIGKTLMVKSVEWLNGRNCQPIRLAVSYGHESVLGFYERLGFYPRLTILEWKTQE